MYFCVYKKEGVITQGRGKNKREFKSNSLGEMIKAAKEYSEVHQNTIDIYFDYGNFYNEEKSTKVASYRKGKNIYFNIK